MVGRAPTSLSDPTEPTDPHRFVEHFSPYCRHCRNFEPTWNEVVDHFESMPDPGVHFAQVNCALNGGTYGRDSIRLPPHRLFPDLCNDNGVGGYPQMNLYRDGEFVDTYHEDREFHLLLEYLGAHAESTGTQSTQTPEEVNMPTPAPSPTEQEATPTPTPSPTPDRLVVQAPRTDANPSGTVIPLDVQSFDAFLAQGPAFIKFFAPW